MNAQRSTSNVQHLSAVALSEGRSTIEWERMKVELEP
ncbi:hypothetical protein D3OALGA1CA_2930 [Olavius algarvensis associated proteobacterium Delta 3]|nr:hypothetical protein D3OALGB2SA_1407 [Olavius algarvensis associated proteobacterium Delta 3]CAB5126392.1 hypothetical protein D3OALGA1CA_2930 [Olavius algarvensis associated proteobacterium Delta 3]